MTLIDDTTIASTAALERRARLRTYILLRWLAIAGQTATVFTVTFVLNFDMALAPALAIIAASGWLNLYLTVAQPTQRFLEDGEAAAHLAFDVLQLAALIAVTGGMDNPFVGLIAAPVVIAFTTLPARFAIGVAGLALAATGFVWALAVDLPWRSGESFDPPTVYALGQWVSLVTAAGFISVFAWRLATDARRMSDALSATSAVLAREQRISALGGLAAAAAHELGTPLATIQVTAKELARALPKGSEEREDALLLMSQAERCRDILGQLSRRGAEGDAVHARLGLRHLLEEVIQPLQGLGPPIAVTVEPTDDRAPRDEPVLARSPEIIYAITNYVENAIDYAKSRVTVTGRWTGEHLEIEVRDDGPGFSDDILAELGQPYVTDRGVNEPHGGLGLGFFIAKTFVERTGGVLAFGNAPPPSTGAVVAARWPLDRVSAQG